MKDFLLRIHKKGKGLRNPLGIFGSALGSSSALIILLLMLGTPAITHADGVVSTALSWVGGLVSDVGDATLGAIFEGIAYILLSFANLILYLIGVVFNYVVQYTVFDFGHLFGTTQGLIDAWGILRDISNIALLFGFIFMGIATILDIHGYEVRKTLPRLIIFAILLNFSLLASQAIIDTSNAFTSVLYAQAGTNCTSGSTATCAGQGISGKILSASGLDTIFKLGSGATNAEDKNAGNTTWGMAYLAMAVFVMILAVVLLAGAIMLTTRAVVLVLLMILSPIGFAGLAIPPLERYAKMWWDKLLSQAFFAPVYLLLIFISLKVMEGVRTSLSSFNGESLVEAIVNSDSSKVGIILIFAIFIGFMIAALIVAKQMGAIGASFAANSASGLVFGVTTRAANFVGGGSAYLARRAIQNSRYADSKVAKAVVNYGFRPLEKANLDVRRVPGMQSVLGAGGITAGAKPAEHATFGDMRHQVQDIKEGKLNRELNTQYEKERKGQQLETNSHDGNKLTADDMTYLNSLSTDELASLHGIKSATQQIAENLTSDQFANLMKSDKLTPEEKTALRSARFRNLGAAVSANNADEVKKWSAKDIVQSGYAANANIANLISDSQYEDIMKSDLPPPQKQALKAVREGTDEEGRFSAGNADRTLNSMGADAIAKLPGTTLAQPQVLNQLDIAEFAAIQKAGKLDRGSRQVIGQHILNIATTPNHPDQLKYAAYLQSDPSVKQFWNTP